MRQKIISQKILVLFLIIAILAGTVLFLKFFKKRIVVPPNINNFEECVSAGYPVLESYPRKCQTPNGKTFTEDIGNELEKLNLIKLSAPRPNQTIQSPLIIKGEARGFWFFEASFPIKLLDKNGNLIAQTIAQAQSGWMTEQFVPFEAKLEFNVSEAQKADLILEKDNPSGLPENDDQLRIPVILEKID